MRRTVEGSDCLLLLGELISDTTLGVSADCLSSANLMIATARDVFIGHHRYQDAPLDRLVGALANAAPLQTRTAPVPSSGADVSPEILQPFDDHEPIRMRHVIKVVNEFVEAHPELPVVTDTGDCLFAAVDIRANECVAPAYYATMGFAVPAAIGIQTATGRRPLVLVGDGAFQMTGPEISRAGLYRCNPILVLLDNSRWEMLQAFFPDAAYNEIVHWPFAKLAELWGGRGVEVNTPAALRAALAAAFDEPRFTLIDVALEPGDISPILRGFVQAFKARVY
jgi:indolepyruvate decarboxylase